MTITKWPATGTGWAIGERPALILIDIVEAYFDKSSPLYADVDDALASAIRVRDTARRAGVFIVYTNVRLQKRRR